MTVTLTVRDTMTPHGVTVIGDHYRHCHTCGVIFCDEDRCPNELLRKVPWQASRRDHE